MELKGVSTYTLINKHGVSSSTINRLRHNKGVTMQTIDDLCTILDCKVEDIAEHVPDAK
jgi:DNA-binding Xre family transcriptional regulator